MKNAADPDKAHDRKAAIAEGWTISTRDDGGFEIQRLDDPEEWPGFDPEKGRVFETDEQVWEHVIARAWAGSPNHKAALAFIETHAPTEYAAMGIEDLKTSSVVWRQQEAARFRVIEAEVRDLVDKDFHLKSAATTVFAGVLEDLHRRRTEMRAKVRNFEAHHEDMVAREAFLIALHDTRDPEKAGEHARRRMLLTATPHEFFGPKIPAAEADDTPRP